MSFTDLWEQQVLNYLFRGTAITNVPTATTGNYYIGLHTGGSAPSDTGSGFVEPAAQTTLTGSTLSTGGPITSLSVAALTVAIPSGASVKIVSGANNQTFTTTALANVGATSLSITSATPNFAYTAGSLVQDVTSGYSRQPVLRHTTDWAAASDDGGGNFQVSNVNAVTFLQDLVTNWGTVTHWGLFDSTTATQPVIASQLTASKAVNVGDTPSFGAGQLVIKLG